MRPNSKKIAINTPQAGLNNAFAGLDLPSLPTGPEAAPAKPVQQSVWKLGRVILRKETAHRGGKTVIVVHDFATHLPQTVIEAAAKKLRQACGCGGTVRGRSIEIQGDQAGKIRSILEQEGYLVGGVT